MDFEQGPESPHSDPGASIVPGMSVSASVAVTRSIPLANWSVVERGLDAPTDEVVREAPTAQYIMREEIGRGGMGEVWRALQVSLGRSVAVKRLLQREEEDGHRAIREHEFRQEARIAGLLEHPNIVPVHDLGSDDGGAPLLSMKLVGGMAWDTMIKEDFFAMEAEEFLAKHLQILLAMTQGVAFAHSRGIVHRDLKPGQVMVGEFGEVMLTDWGLAICFDPGATPIARDAQAEKLSHGALPSPETASNPAGTPALMAPEQTYPDARSIGPWTDVYLLGGTLYALLTGSLPHYSKSTEESMKLARAGVIIHPAEKREGRFCPDGLVRICLKALEADPDNRYCDAAEFHRALRDYLSGAENRARSRTLVHEAQELVSSKESRYSELARALSMVEDAVRLWPENQQAMTLREACLGAQAHISIRGGDLRLAHISIERMQDGDRRTELRDKLKAAEGARDRAVRERTLLRRATVVLLVGIMCGAGWFTWQLSRQRKGAVDSRDQAQQARGRAEDLLGFLIGDLRQRLEPTGRLDVMNSVGAKADEYLQSVARETDGGGDADAGSTSGGKLESLETAVKQLQQEMKDLEAFDPANRQSLQWLATAAKGYQALAVDTLEAGDPQGARRAADSSRELFRSLRQDDPDNFEWMAGEVDATQFIGRILCAESCCEDAQIYYDEAEAILWREVNSGNHSIEDRQFLGVSLAELLGAQSTAILPSGRAFEATELARRSVAIAQQLLHRRPDNPALQGLLGKQLYRLGEAMEVVDTPAALLAVQQSAPLLLDASLRNPEDTQLGLDAGISCHIAASVLRDSGSPKEALAVCRDGIVAISTLLRQNASLGTHKNVLHNLISFSDELEVQLYPTGMADLGSSSFELMISQLNDSETSSTARANLIGDFSQSRIDLIHESLECGNSVRLAQQDRSLAALLAAVLANDPTKDLLWAEGHAQLARARAHQIQGEWKEAEAAYLEADATMKQLSDSWVGGQYTRYLMIELGGRQRAVMAWQRGDRQEAARLLDESSTLLAECRALQGAPEPLPLVGDSHYGWTLVLWGLFERDKGNMAAAQARWREAVEVMKPHAATSETYLLQPLAAAMLLLGEKPQVDELLARINEACQPDPLLDQIMKGSLDPVAKTGGSV